MATTTIVTMTTTTTAAATTTSNRNKLVHIKASQLERLCRRRWQKIDSFVSQAKRKRRKTISTNHENT
jgi:hypothetical protein